MDWYSLTTRFLISFTLDIKSSEIRSSILSSTNSSTSRKINRFSSRISRMRPGLATSTCTPSLIIFSCSSQSPSMPTVAHSTWAWYPIAQKSSSISWASSWWGVSTKIWVPLFFFSSSSVWISFSSAGTINEPYFPFASPSDFTSTSLPSIASGITDCCIWVGSW